MSRDLREGLKRAAEELDAAQPSPGMDARLRARLESPARIRWWIPALVPVAAAIIAVLIFTRQQTIGGFAIVEQQGLRADAREGVVHLEQGSALLAVKTEGVQLRVTAPIDLKRDDPGARIIRGSTEVAVEKRKSGQPPLRILVSDGAIEVLGTTFLVVQEETKGHVTLHEGSIRFVATDGRVRMVKPGETLEWPLPAEAAVAPTPAPEPEPVAAAPQVPVISAPAPKHHAAPAPAPIHYVDADDLLRQVDTLRSRGEFGEAVRYLTHGLTRELKPGTRERFSFELGIILTDQMHDSVKACAHWKKHTAAYGEGRYGVEVQRASSRAGCSK